MVYSDNHLKEVVENGETKNLNHMRDVPPLLLQGNMNSKSIKNPKKIGRVLLIKSIETLYLKNDPRTIISYSW